MVMTVLTGLSYSLVTDADEEDRSSYPAYQNTISIDTQSFGKLSLSITAEEHNLPEDTKISLKEVTDKEYQDIQAKLIEDGEENNTDIKGILLYDLSFTDSNGNEIPSSDSRNINVYAGYENDASPLTENNNEDVSVKLVNKDQQYTVTDLSKENISALDTDDNNAVKDMSMSVHGSTYYALVWSKRPEVTVHAVDEEGNDIIPVNTIQLTDDEYTDTLKPSVEGYTLTSVTGDNTEITKVKPENGKLYFHNGKDWFEASDSNVYYHYVSDQVSEDTDSTVPVSEPVQEDTDTEEVTEPESTDNNLIQLTDTTEDKKYTVTVTYGKEAGLPEGTTLSVTGIDSNEEKYADAKKAVSATKNVDEDTLGMDALDITLSDPEGNKVEPDNASNVQVSISANDLPDDVDSVEIHHITDEDVTADTVAEDIEVSDNSANAEFSVNSFSVFTITWNTTKGDKTYRFANVRLHYVTEKGLTIDDPTTLPASAAFGDGAGESANNNIVTLSDWANDENENSRVEGYTYVEARIGDKDGRVITGLKGVKSTSDNKDTYRLYYTTDKNVDANSNWQVYTDSVSGKEDNNANVYMVFKTAMVAPITVHYMDTNGNPLKDSAGNEITRVFDVAALTATTNNTGFTDMSDSTNGLGTSINGYSMIGGSSVNTANGSNFYAGNTDPDKVLTYNYVSSVTLPPNQKPNFTKNAKGSINGATFRFIKYDSDNKRILVAKSTNGQYAFSVTDASGENADFGIYITYPVANNLTVTIHRVDADGNKIADDVTKTVPSNNVYTVTSSDATAVNGYSLSGMHHGSYSGTSFTTMTYAKGTVTWTSTADNNSTSTDNLASEVWAVYQAANTVPVTIHHVDSNGKLIAPDTKKTISTTSTVVSPSSETITGYTADKMYYGWTDSNNKGTAITSMTYNLNDGNWSSLAKISESDTGNNTDTLQKELWVEYSRSNDNQIIIHYVDENGAPIADNYLTNITVEQSAYTGKYDGYTMGNSSSYQKNISGYTYTKEYIGSISDTYEVPSGNKIMYHYDSTTGWQTGQGTGTEQSGFTKLYDSLVTDIYHVYKNNKTSKDFTVHYSYITNDNTAGTTDKVNQTFTLPAGKSQDLLPKDPVNGTVDNTYVPTNVTKDGRQLTYMATRLGSIQGPDIHGVQVTSDGTVQYHYDQHYTLPKQRGVDRWYYSAASGRNFTMTLTNGNYTLIDSQHGSLELNLTENSSNATDWGNDKSRVWTATYEGDVETTKYTVTVGSENNGRRLEVEDWLPNVNTNIYVVYLDDNTDPNADGKLWIEDDLKYSGYFQVGMSDSLTKVTGNKYQYDSEGNPVSTTSNVRYAWYRRNGNGNWEEVTRKQDFTHYNLEYDAGNRTWLDVEADMGRDVWRSGDNIQYKVKVTYDTSKITSYEFDSNYNVTNVVTETPVEKSVESEPISVSYYGQLENGDFETPATIDYTDDNGNEIKGYRDQNGSLIFDGAQTSNTKYKAAGGVWQSTGIGTGRNSGKDIEICNVSNAGGATKYWYDETRNQGFDTQGSGETRHAKAADGRQLAEINCATPGALYQDVITHPNEQLSYWFSHRARMEGTNDRGFDSLYLVIMPTKLAMTSGSDGGELKTQDDLVNFIGNHGGYDNAAATTQENKVTYRDEDNGILIRKVSSDTKSWHNINETADYLAKGGLTRFFFASGAAHLGNTLGNFIDAVGFSQSPRTPDGFSLTIQKAFTNLTPAQVASMKDNFQITLSDKHINSMTGAEDSNSPNTALNGAVLGFDCNESGGNYTFTPYAKQGDTDLITDTTSSANARIINGNVVMTWILDDQKLDSNDQYYNYKATETGATVDGYRVTERQTPSPAAIADSNAVTIHQNETGRISINNTYTPHGETEEPQLTVRKVFAGVTPRQVDSLFSHGYKITVTGPGSDNTSISYDLSTNTDQMDASILLDEDVNTDGSTVLKWTIPNMKAGTYTIAESGLEANQSDNKLTKVTVNGANVDIPTDLTNATVVTKDNIAVGASTNASDIFGFDNTSSPQNINTVNSVQQPDNTNLIVARYSVKTTSESVETTTYKYLVWTRDTLGIKSGDVVMNKIKDLWGLTDKPADADVFFRSGDNPGSMTMTIDGGAKVKATYDSHAHSLTFASPDRVPEGTTISWDKYYSTHYAVKDGLGKTYGWEDDSDITIENLYNPIVKIQKVSTEGEFLAGGKFRLYRIVNNQKQYYLAKSTVAAPQFAEVNDVDTYTTTSRTNGSTDALAFTTADSTNADNGTTLGVIEIGALEKASDDTPDTYYLEEVKAPDGYNKLVKPVSFTVDKEGTIEAGAASDSVDNSTAAIDYQSDARYYVIRITNTPGSLLPITGGMGTYLFYIAGGLIVAIAVLLLVKRHINKE